MYAYYESSKERQEKRERGKMKNEKTSLQKMQWEQ